jgi:hypothetical protein
MAASLSRGLFPRTLVDATVLDRVGGLLDARHPAGLRRVVAEQRSDLERAVRARGLS